MLYKDPDAEVSAMCHRNHVARAYLYEQETVPDAQYTPVPDAQYTPVPAKSGPVIHIIGEKEAEADPAPEHRPTIRQVKRILGSLARMGGGLVFVAGVADGLIDTTYGMILAIVCVAWGMLELLKAVAHG